MRKKSQTGEDLIYFVVIIALLGIGALVANRAYTSFYDNVQNISVINNTAAMDAFDAGNTVNNMWDYLILAVFIGFTIGMVILGYFVDASSVFMPIFLLVMLIGLVVAGVIQYTWNTVSAEDVLSPFVNTKLPITSHLLSNLGIYYVVVAGLSFMATYAKVRDDR